VYQRLPRPFATQQGAFVGNGGVGPVIGKRSRFLFTMAKLSGLWAGVNPSTLSQNAAPSGVLLAVFGSVTAALDPASAPSWMQIADVVHKAEQHLPRSTRNIGVLDLRSTRSSSTPEAAQRPASRVRQWELES
jgi:hypothetical protein